MSLLAMVFFIFLSVNMMFYYAMTTLLPFLAIIYRVSTVFDMEEYSSERTLEPGREAIVKMEDCDFSWGFRVSEQRAEDKASPSKKTEKKKRNSARFKKVSKSKYRKKRPKRT